jgi:hypothetical protein
MNLIFNTTTKRQQYDEMAYLELGNTLFCDAEGPPLHELGHPLALL